ncbi:MAG: hypothetical protein ACREDW_10485 [Aestuariivirgaceae bacterium]
MRAGRNLNHRVGKVGTVIGSALLAGLVVMALELVDMALAGPNSAAQVLTRSTEAFVAVERHIGRGGAIAGYQVRF